MRDIRVLDEKTIDKIAAGEVVDRPLNVVKELVENSIDSGALSITVEIKDGGTSLIRVTDNGCGIPKEQISTAFLRHATSKIQNADDLLAISSLGFRGEALSSVCAVSYVEVISKEKDNLLGYRYVIEGSKELSLNDIGAPDGTTMIIKDLFFNVPARKKFLKSAQTEAGYVSDMMENLALSHPEIAFKFIINGRNVFSTNGNGELREVIYRIYGKEVTASLIPLKFSDSNISVDGFIAKPEMVRSNRSFEKFYVNKRYVRFDLLSKAVEEGYKNFLMQHKFPFVVLHLEINPTSIDVNVHPSKMEIRMDNSKEIYDIVSSKISETISEYELIPQVSLDDPGHNSKDVNVEEIGKVPEPFEVKRLERENGLTKSESTNIPLPSSKETLVKPLAFNRPSLEADVVSEFFNKSAPTETLNNSKEEETSLPGKTEQIFLNPDAKDHYKVLGQIFKTYWLIGFSDKLFIMDQHAAHEKVKYERLIKMVKNKDIASQYLCPPIVINVSPAESAAINENIKSFEALGFEIEDFGLGSIALRAVPLDLFGCNESDFFKEILDEIINNPLRGSFDVITDKVASMACKAAVKGNTEMSVEEISALLDELLTLDNPYNCPHGRPTIISMSKYDIDKKFKRVVN